MVLNTVSSRGVRRRVVLGLVGGGEAGGRTPSCHTFLNRGFSDESEKFSLFWMILTRRKII